MTKPTPNKNKLIGRVVTVASGQHAGSQGVILWIAADDGKARLQTSTSLITVDLADLEIDHDRT